MTDKQQNRSLMSGISYVKSIVEIYLFIYFYLRHSHVTSGSAIGDLHRAESFSYQRLHLSKFFVINNIIGKYILAKRKCLVELSQNSHMTDRN